MATINPPAREADLRGFLEAAGKSLTEAQGTLTGDSILTPSALAISEAELEVKAAVTQQAGGKLALQTLSMESLRSGIDPGLVSTVHIRYVAVAADATKEPGSTGGPKRVPEEITKTVAARADIAALSKILGKLNIAPVFVPETRRWMVVARDQEGRVLRELIVPDDPDAGSLA
ncbi:MAG: hypothetical protein QOG51_1341 [Verrucomicrobiota bacterium]|jgi:hypothetical protein